MKGFSSVSVIAGQDGKLTASLLVFKPSVSASAFELFTLARRQNRKENHAGRERKAKFDRGIKLNQEHIARFPFISTQS